MPSVSYTTPGVYIEEDTSLSLSISTSPTAIPVFIGKFLKVNGEQPELVTCIKINSWLDFISQFSLPTLTVSIKVDSGKKIDSTGSEILISNNANKFNATAELPLNLGAFAVQHYFSNGGGPCYILPLVANSDLATLPDLIEKQQEITLLVCPETDVTLSPIKKSDVYSNINTLLQGNKIDYFLIADSEDGEYKSSTQEDKTAVYYPNLKTPFTYTLPPDKSITLEGYSVETISNLAELNKPATLDDYNEAKKSINDAINNNIKPIVLPPSAAVAGAYATTDSTRGVWKAPANVVLRDAIPDTMITDKDQSELTSKGINAIRYFVNKGTVIWGARTLVSQETPDWLYVPVRRLFNSVERDIEKAMQFAVFEPNSQPTWERVRSAIDNYLYQLWQQGALMGNSPKEAYFVHIGKDITMSDDDIKNGKMIVKVGMAAVRPAEFIILQFSQNIAQ
ncbi:phage tail sheath family protein [Xenorhabdus bovienii]|uniref:phage tail sheath family protein n=1 Tax=Xenorhabdus bovienii TaxID=40576 RepID=UPI00237CAEC1|nr:phage tail sheath C-terminal domain-containing protein [Xenorhabdus bovienii]MDE1482858.1 phage tail sheath subtilisin-like domain-containing protein [Xenorhabdus bovienii]MDE9431728.1 phage tail sheath subtilisin-like domain-containing protein [Xenorhabdus bovienii]MDE9441813.1 phage tail sheath subtilisin-like domain-containing protein [Xenorhabdus bovienii]MDE9461074.1 phage tail sheath subtilisin-like domain-containing protein [Xenorhabdus bovienii]MDE9468189.1 phage tail sheath subtili